MKLRLLIPALLAAALLMLTAAGAPAALRPCGAALYLDGAPLRGEAGEPVRVLLLHGVAYAPVRALGEALDCSVQWDAEARAVLLQPAGRLRR